MKMNIHDMTEAYRKAGGRPEVLKDKDYGYLMVHGNEILGLRDIEGLDMESVSKERGVDITFKMKRGYSCKKPVILCFGVLPEEGEQEIRVNGTIEDDADVEFLAYCVFPNSKKVRHLMIGDICIQDKASFKYTEIHYHGSNGGVEVMPKLRLSLQANSYYGGNFYLTKGRAGNIDIDYDVTVGRESHVELLSKILASSNDKVNIKEKVTLQGKNSKGFIRTKTVGKNNSVTNVISEIVACQPGCIGHVDCIETILDEAIARAIPLVDVRNKGARVTHEAAVGSLNYRQLEVLMSRGLREEEATDLLIKSMLR